jgi:HPt (histidine-containing phosphotransfer) domain-containing protein
MERCLNDEAFYLEMAQMALEDNNFSALSAAVEAGDKKAAFEAAHALKGIIGNISLTPMYAQISEMTELLRAGQDADYSGYLGRILQIRDELLAP